MTTAKLIPIHSSIDTAEKLRKVDNPNDISSGILTEEEFLGIELEDRKPIVRGFLTEESITIVNGFRGQGKSWLIMALGNEISWGGEVGPWKVEKPMNVMIIDGEMPMKLLQERLKMLNRGRDIKRKPKHLYVYPENYAYRIGINRANILDSVWRERIAEEVIERKVGVLVLDNLSSLAPGIDENDKMPFDPVNRWMLELRFHGVAIVMTHHTGKSGEQRGTSAHEDHVDTAILLTRPGKYTADMGCKFKCAATKDRAHVLKGETTMLQLVEGEKGRLQFSVVVEEGKGTLLKMAGMTREAAKAAGISDRTYYRIKKEMKEEK